MRFLANETEIPKKKQIYKYVHYYYINTHVHRQTHIIRTSPWANIYIYILNQRNLQNRHKKIDLKSIKLHTSHIAHTHTPIDLCKIVIEIIEYNLNLPNSNIQLALLFDFRFQSKFNRINFYLNINFPWKTIPRPRCSNKNLALMADLYVNIYTTIFKYIPFIYVDQLYSNIYILMCVGNNFDDTYRTAERKLTNSLARFMRKTVLYAERCRANADFTCVYMWVCLICVRDASE